MTLHAHRHTHCLFHGTYILAKQGWCLFWQSQCHRRCWLAGPPPLWAFNGITRLLKLKAHFFFSLFLGRSDGEGWEWGVEEVRFTTSRCNWETGVWDVEGEVENLSAKVVNLFLASFSEKKKKEEEAGKLLECRSCRLMLTLKLWHKMARSDATSAHSDF